MSLIGKSKKPSKVNTEPSDPNPQSNPATQASLKSFGTPVLQQQDMQLSPASPTNANSSESSEVSMTNSTESPDSKPRAKTTIAGIWSHETLEPEATSLAVASRCLFDHRKPPPDA
jgi:hypothetical protein